MNKESFGASLRNLAIAGLAIALIWVSITVVFVPVVGCVGIGRKWVVVIAFLAAFGGFGGILGSLALVPLSRILSEGMRDYGSAFRLVWAVLIGMLMGSGGAIAFSVVLELDGRLKDPLTDDALVLLAGVGVAVGYVGNRMLKKVGDQLLKEDVESLRDQTEEQLKTLRAQQTALAAAMGSAGDALSKPRTERGGDVLRKEAVTSLEAVQEHFPENRTVGIFIGRLYRNMLQYEQAVNALGRFLAMRQKRSIKDPKDDSALHYNRMCYLNLWAKQLEDATPPDTIKAEELRQRAWEEAKIIAAIYPSDIDNAKNDPDCEGLEKTGHRNFANLR